MSSIWGEKSQLANHFFWPYWLLLEDHLEPSIFFVGWHFTGVVAAMHSFRGYMKQIIFDSSCLLRTATFMEDLFRDSRAVYLFHHSNCDHPTLDSVFIYFFIYSLNGATFILTGELAVIRCLSSFFSSSYCNYFLEYSLVSIVSTVLCIFLMLKFAAIRFGHRTCFQRISEHQSPRNKLLLNFFWPATSWRFQHSYRFGGAFFPE